MCGNVMLHDQNLFCSVTACKSNVEFNQDELQAAEIEIWHYLDIAGKKVWTVMIKIWSDMKTKPKHVVTFKAWKQKLVLRKFQSKYIVVYIYYSITSNVPGAKHTLLLVTKTLKNSAMAHS